MIEIKNINKNFGKTEALKNISVIFKEGECIAFIGPNGCGKTTLIKSILGMVIPNSGEIYVDSTHINNQFQYRENIGYMPQIGRYPDMMTIKQVLEMIKKIRNKPVEFLDFELYEAFNIKNIEHKQMRTLSGGTTQKVSAVLAFLFNPKILILDEPTAGLDPLASEILKEKIIKAKNQGKLVLITSHLLNELDDLITEIVFMQDGELKFHKKINDLQKETNEIKVSKAIAKILKDTKND